MTNEEKLIEICADVMSVDVAKLSLETNRDELGEFDSLAIIQIIAEMEDKFGVSISEEVLETAKIEKISDFLKLI